MQPRSLLMKFDGTSAIRLSNQLLPDHKEMEIDEVRVFASAPPWRAMHDLLVDPETHALAGIVYAVAEPERAVIADRCSQLPSPCVRYCVSPRFAAEILRDPSREISDFPRNWGSDDAPVFQFPKSILPYRQDIRAAMNGESDRLAIPDECARAAADYFDSIAKEEGAGSLKDWPGGDVDRVEVTWMNKPVHPNLPSCFPSALEVVLAQFFAEDIWFYRLEDNELVAVGINHLDRTLAEYKLCLPAF